MANKHDFTREFSLSELFNRIAWYIDGLGHAADEPNAIAVVNPDGSNVGSGAPSGTTNVNNVGNTIGLSTEVTLAALLAKLRRSEEHLLDKCEATAGFTAVGDAANLATSNQHVQGSASLEWDKTLGSDIYSGVQKTLGAAITLENVIRYAARVRITPVTTSQLASVWIRLGTDASNWTEFSVTTSNWQFRNGWNDVVIPLAGEEVVTFTFGTGMDSDNIAWFAAGISTNPGGDTRNNIRLDSVSLVPFSDVVINRSNRQVEQAPITRVGIVGDLFPGGLGKPWDIQADNTKNAGFVQSESLAQETGGNLDSIGGATAADHAAAPSRGMALAGKYEASPTTVDDGDLGLIAISNDRHLIVDAEITTPGNIAQETGGNLASLVTNTGNLQNTHAADDAAAPSRAIGIGGKYLATPDSVDDGDIGIVAMSADRHLVIDVDDVPDAVKGSDPPLVSDADWITGVYVKASGGGAPSNANIDATVPTGRLHVCDLHVSVGAATVITLTEETSGTVIEKFDFGDKGGTIIHYDPRWPDRLPGAVGKRIQVSSTVDVNINIKYRMYDA